MSGRTKAAPESAPRAAPARGATTVSRARAIALQRCACGGHGGECTECRRKRAAMQKSSTGPATPGAMPHVVEQVLTAPGHSLDPDTRRFMEPRFGSDFSGVRVHTDALAADSANAVNANAWTVGQDIAFAAGRYQPSTPEGQTLLAHELAHTVQQRGLQRSSTDGVSLEGGAEYERLEREAERAAASVMAGSARTGAGVATRPTLSRKSKDDPTIRDAKSKGKTGKTATSALGTHAVVSTNVFESAAAAPKEDSGSIAEFQVTPFYVPASKGPDALPIYQAKATGGSLESTVSLSGGRTKTALWQEREGTGELRSLWLQKLGWTAATADDLWERAGGDKVFPQIGGKSCQMDHIIELQVGGNNTNENLQPLDGAENRASGGAIKSQVESLAKCIASDKDFEAGSATQIKLRFTAAVKHGSHKPAATGCSGKKTRSCLEVEACAKALKTTKSATGALVIERVDYPLSAGGSPTAAKVPVTFAGRQKEIVPLEGTPENSGASTLIPGLLLRTLGHGDVVKGKLAGDVVEAHVDNGKDRETRLPISLAGDPPVKLRVEAGGVLKLDESTKSKGIAFQYKYLSPGAITSMELDGAGKLAWNGWIKPSIPFLGKLDVRYADEKLLVTRGLEPDTIKKIKLLGMQLTRADVSMQLGPAFKPEGNLEARLGPENKPLATANLKIGVDSVGLVAVGEIKARIPRMEEATSTLTYYGGEGRDYWEAKLDITSEKIKLGSATVSGGFHGRFDKGGIAFDGRVTATFPNDSTADLGLKYDEGEGWVLSGGGTFHAPKIKPVVVRATYYLEKDKLVAKGKTGLTLREIGTDIDLDPVTLEITKGQPVRLYGTGKAHFDKGKAKGDLIGTLHPDGKVTGKGTLSYMIRPDLIVQGGVELDDKQKLHVTGALTFARLELFKGYHPPPRNLFAVDFPIPVPGASIGGIGLQFIVRGSVDVGFSFGPGVLEPLTIDAKLDPLEDDPNLEVGVGGQLKIPASAYLTAKLEGSLAVSALIAKAEAGLGLAGTIALEGGVFAKFEARYKNHKFVAELTPEIRAELLLMLALTAFAKVTVGWGPLSTGARKDWKLAARKIRTGIEFALKASFG